MYHSAQLSQVKDVFGHPENIPSLKNAGIRAYTDPF